MAHCCAQHAPEQALADALERLRANGLRVTNPRQAMLAILAREHGGNREIVVSTDGEPTAHCEDGQGEFAYPPTPAADPLLDPPGVRSSAHGFRVRDGSAYANWVVTILPNRIPPARFKRAIGSASLVGMRFAYGRKPAVVVRQFWA